ncbi:MULTISPECIES: FAD-dependent oxidoreductase [Bacillus]|uniref:FAD-dependent oxidoreductase n=1 Tax=Bacillus TaxID=1386 RepID=UPI0002FFA7E5
MKIVWIISIKEGGNIRTNSRVIKIDAEPDKVTVTLDDGTIFTAGSTVISAGAWSGDLLQQLNLDLPLNPIRKTFAWYEINEELYNENKFPGFAFQLEEKNYYGFPSIDGARLKIGRHDGGETIHPDEERTIFGDVPGDKEDLNNFLRTYMPLVGQLKFGKTCMYTMTPDEDFIIDVHPLYKNIAIAAGFSGHGFKFASAVGETLSELVTKGSTKLDISPFSIKRFIK